MERTVRIMQQSPLVTRKYMDRKTGDEKVINSVTMVVREWNSQQTGEAMQATTIYVDKINLM